VDIVFNCPHGSPSERRLPGPRGRHYFADCLSIIYDTGRRSFLATEEIHFVRNVLTNVPADPIVLPDGPLSILLASAQPVGFGRLSIEQEVEVIRRGFKPLIDAGLAVVDTVARITPAELHDRLSRGTYQVVHFIGHGVYDEKRREGCLVFENDRGRRSDSSSSTSPCRSTYGTSIARKERTFCGQSTWRAGCGTRQRNSAPTCWPA
jgi:hypothetical protein